MQSERFRRFSGWRAFGPGLLTALIIAFAATFISDHYGGPQLLYALFFGMAFNFLAAEPKTQPGIELAAREVLRFGVALLGARITVEQVTSLGLVPAGLAVLGVVVTIAFGAWLGRLLKRPLAEGLLTGGAVAICGASAALAISAVLPKTADSERFTLFTVVGVTALSTAAMIVYPALAQMSGLDATAAGMFLGGTIHDVAQVVGAGVILSPEAGDTAIIIKLLRVALLVPVVLTLSLLLRRAGGSKASRQPLLPAFLVGFVLLIVVNSTGVIPPHVVAWISDLSRWCLVVAIAALGVKTSFQKLAELGWQPMALMVGETVFLACLILGGLVVLRHVQ